MVHSDWSQNHDFVFVFVFVFNRVFVSQTNQKLKLVKKFAEIYLLRREQKMIRSENVSDCNAQFKILACLQIKKNNNQQQVFLYIITINE